MPDERSSSEPIDELAAFAVELAVAARRVTLGLSPADRQASNKADQGGYDPVTQADRAAETVIRGIIGERYPSHGIAGEEFPDAPGSGSISWSIDPIDGTRSYICGLPTWTTLIASLDNDEPVLGLIDAPCLDEIYVGHAGGAWMDRGGERRPISASGCTQISEARFSTTDPFLFGATASLL